MAIRHIKDLTNMTKKQGGNNEYIQSFNVILEKIQ